VTVAEMQNQTKGLTKTGMKGRVLEVKAAEGGIGAARVAFAQLNVVDHDRDYTVPGAFQVGQQLKVCQTGHAHGALPIGAGEIVGEIEMEGALWAVADVKLFTDTVAGKDTHTVLKHLQSMGHQQEWSYGYDILEAGPGEVEGRPVQILKRLSVYEVSPVLRGAGIGTHTIGVKGFKDWSSDSVYQAWAALHPYVDGEPGSWVADVRHDPNTVIVRDGEQLLQIPYEVNDADEVTFDESAAVEVTVEYVPKALDDATGAKADDEIETCADCGKNAADCPCPDAKGRAEDLAVAFMAMEARSMGVPIAD
jgi:hypothetical protein